MSISKAQASALAAGFLNNVGSEKDDFLPKETFTEVIALAGELIETAQKNLEISNSIASGKLSESITAGDPKVENHIFSVDILMLFYGQFVDKGVKGTKSGKGQYQFKNDMPSKKMVESIQKWIKLSSRSVSNAKKTISAHERKRKSISALNQGRNIAFATARSVLQHGIQPTGFMSNAIKTTANKVSDRLGAALKVDIINSII